MAHLQEISISVPERGSKNTFFSFVLTLTLWRIRLTWLLLLTVMLGMIAAVIVSCAVPLIFPITTTAGLRGMLREQPTNSQINCDVTPLGLSSRVMQTIQQQSTSIFQQNIGGYLNGNPQFSIDSSNIDSLSPHVSGKHYFHVISTSMQSAAAHIKVIQGRLPHLTNTPANDIEILMTPNTAVGLHLHVGSVMVLDFPFYTHLSEPLAFPPVNPTIEEFRAHVVGLFTVNSTNLTYWQGLDFEPYTVKIAVGKETIFHYFLLLPLEGLSGLYDGLSAKYHIETPFAVSGNTLTWTYTLNSARFTATQLNTAIGHMTNLKSSFDIHYAGAQSFNGFPYDINNPPPFPYIVKVILSGPPISIPGTPSNLEQYRSRVAITNIPTLLIAVQIVSLILFFVSLMTDVLVERQANTIAILRSRGASRSQIFSALLTQSVILGIIAVIIGVPLALLVVLFITQHTLPTTIRDSLSVVAAHPVTSALSTLGYATVVMLVMLLTMSVSLGRAVGLDVLSKRRTASRSSRVALWQRLHLDVIAGITALTGYLISLYLSNVDMSFNSTSQPLIVFPLSLIAPFFLVIGCLLLSLRLLPLLLYFGARLAVRGRSAASMLALAQMARFPQQAMRMTLLLALAIGFTLFAFIFSASQEQRISDLAAYQTGADFSGVIPMNAPQQSVETWTSTYKTIPGVTSASVGYAVSADPVGQRAALHLYVQAVDSSTFDSTAIWPPASSSQSLSSLMMLLNSQRQQGIMSGVAPIIIDTTVSSKLGLRVGSILHITTEDDSLLTNDLTCRIVDIIQRIPMPNPLNNTTTSTIPTGGILLDYQTYNAVYIQAAQNIVGKGHAGILPNYIWLRTRDDANSVTRVRAILNRDNYFLNNLQDRRAIIDQQHADPLTITLIGMLDLGIVVTLLLAILGDILTSWLTVYTRLTNFVVLRALGTSPRQVASVLVWEQALIYSIGLLLGLAFGTLLASTIVPTLITHNTIGVNPLPARLIIPSTLILALLGVFIMFVSALGMMIYNVSKPSMSQILRLNED